MSPTADQISEALSNEPPPEAHAPEKIKPEGFKYWIEGANLHFAGRHGNTVCRPATESEIYLVSALVDLQRVVVDQVAALNKLHETVWTEGYNSGWHDNTLHQHDELVHPTVNPYAVRK